MDRMEKFYMFCLKACFLKYVWQMRKKVGVMKEKELEENIKSWKLSI